MLTGDLLMFTRRKDRLYPRLLEPCDTALAAAGEALLDLFEAHQGRRRGDLEEALKDFALPDIPAKVSQGLAKLLLKRCTFAVAATEEPRILRRALFDGSARAWRSRDRSELAGWRASLLEQVGMPHGLSADQVETSLYADLPENQVLEDIRPVSSEKLLYRYNVAQVQGLLLRAKQLTLSAPSVNSRRMRQLFRYLKFFGLLFQVESGEGEGLRLVLDGPLSLLESGTRYGLNLAQFFPVLLHWDAPWRLECILSPRPGKPPARLELGPSPLLKSHYPDQGQWVPEELRRFQEGFNGLSTPWRAVPTERIFTLPGNRWLVPDLEFALAGSERRVFLEFLPYPVPQRVDQRLSLIAQRGKGDYLLACRKVPALQKVDQECPWLLTFRRSFLPKRVLEFLETLPDGGFLPTRP